MIIGLLIAAMAGLWLFTTYSRGAYVTVSFPHRVRVHHTVEVDVHVLWLAARPVSTLLLLNRISGWKTTRFGPGGYESRDFCDEDNGPDKTRSSHSSAVWLTGGLWHGASCSLRLFLIPTRIGHFVVQARLLMGTLAQLAHRAGVHSSTTELQVTVTR